MTGNTVCAHEAWIVDLRDGEEALWSALHRNIRRQVRMARKNELTVEIDRSGVLVDDFYDVLGQFSHAAGTPVFAKAFLESVVTHFPNGLQHRRGLPGDRNPSAAISSWRWPIPCTACGALHCGSTSTCGRSTWATGRILADAIEHGFEYLDMGRAPVDSSASKYKGQWNGVSVPVYQQTMPLRGAEEAGNVATQAQEDGKFQLVRQIWPKLPYPVAQHLGPMLRRHVPFA